MRKKLGFLVVMLAVVGTGAYVLASDFGDDDANQNISVIVDPPGGSDCYCPAVWAPVVCRRENPDGSISKAFFSNGCVAGCNGYTKCARVELAPSILH